MVDDWRREEHRHDRGRGHERLAQHVESRAQRLDGAFSSDDASWRRLRARKNREKKKNRHLDRDTAQVFSLLPRTLKYIELHPPAFALPARGPTTTILSDERGVGPT